VLQSIDYGLAVSDPDRSLDLFVKATIADMTEKRLSFFGRIVYASNAPGREGLVLSSAAALAMAPWVNWATGGVLMVAGGVPLVAIGIGIPWLKTIGAHISLSAWVLLALILATEPGRYDKGLAGVCVLFALIAARAGMLFSRQMWARWNDFDKLGRCG